jgi:hypothetical protein
MPHIREVTVYQFDELSDHAKEQARQWYRTASQGDNYFAESVIEDAATIADLLGINLRQTTVKLMGGGTRQEPTIYWSGFWSQGDGACFEGTYYYAKGSTRKIREHAPQDTDLHTLTDGLAAVQRKYWYQLQASVKHRGHYQHELCTEIDVESSGLINADRITPEDADTVRELLRDFMRWIYRQLEKEYEYQNSDEVVDETIRANEYEFDEEGNRA